MKKTPTKKYIIALASGLAVSLMPGINYLREETEYKRSKTPLQKTMAVAGLCAALTYSLMVPYVVTKSLETIGEIRSMRTESSLVEKLSDPEKLF